MSTGDSTSTGLRVVVVDPADTRAVAALRALVIEYVQTWYAPGQLFSGPDVALLAALPAPYGTPNARALLAVLDDVPVGCLLVCAAPGDPQALELRKLFVWPSARRSGAGRALLGAAAEFAASVGARRLALCVHADARPARELYLAAGFAETGVVTDGFVWMAARLPL